MYLISALNNALKNFLNKTWRQCCQEASESCSIITTAYSGETIEDWWISFRTKNGFTHPRGNEGCSKEYKSRLPLFFRDNEDLHNMFVKWGTENLSDLTTERARQFIVDKLYPLAVPLTEGSAQEQENERAQILKRLYNLSPTPSTSTIWEWLTRSGFSYKPRTKRFLLTPMNRFQIAGIVKSRLRDTSRESQKEW